MTLTVVGGVRISPVVAGNAPVIDERCSCRKARAGSAYRARRLVRGARYTARDGAKESGGTFFARIVVSDVAVKIALSTAAQNTGDVQTRACVVSRGVHPSEAANTRGVGSRSTRMVPESLAACP